MTREDLVQIMRKELQRQYASRELGWYTEGYEYEGDNIGAYSYCAVDGNSDLGKIADAILNELKTTSKV
jgi:hypothetical protein